MTDDNNTARHRIQRALNRVEGGSVEGAKTPAKGADAAQKRRQIRIQELLEQGYLPFTAQRLVENEEIAKAKREQQRSHEENSRIVHEMSARDSLAKFRPKDQREYNQLTGVERLMAQHAGFKGQVPEKPTKDLTPHERIARRERDIESTWGE